MGGDCVAKTKYKFSVGIKKLTKNINAVIAVDINEKMSEGQQDLELMKAYDEWLGEVLQYSVEKI